MRFLINMNLPRNLVFYLDELGHDCRHIADIGMAEASDSRIVETARASDETILTHDLDYGEILAFSGAAKPSVVVFRLRNVHVSRLVEKIRAAWPRILSPLEEGAIVILSDTSIRIRRLPVDSTGLNIES